MAKKAKKIDKKSKAPVKSAAKSAKAAPKAAKKVSAPAKKAAPAKKKAAKAPAPSPVKKAAKPGIKVVAKKDDKNLDKKVVAKKDLKPSKDAKVDAKSIAKKVEPAKEELKSKKGKAGAEKLAEKPIEAKAKKGKKEPEVEAEEVIEAKAPVKDVVLTDAEGRELCRVKDCDQPWVVEGYCRYHYLLFWKKIQNRKKILSEGKLEQYIEELTSRYPLKFLELIRKDLSSEPDFFSAIQELDIDEGNNIDEFEDENFMEEVRGIGATETERVDDEY
jgi:hypothetical protein